MNEELEMIKSLYEYSEEETKRLYDEQKKDREKILIKISKIMLTYKIIDNLMKIDKKNKILIYSSISTLTNELFSNQGKHEIKKTTEILDKTINKKYNFLNEIKKTKELSKKDIKKVINKTIENKNYSDRIWSNKRKTAGVIKKEVKKFIQGKTDVNLIEDKIKRKFNSNAYETKRLVEHEVARVQSEITDKWFKDNNINKVQYNATLDKRTCSDCDKYDGEIFNLNGDRPSLPQHVLCRCYYSPVDT